MKIHRIETVNLNSLYGELEVDLAATLGDASLFLIFGPTGAGKSTLTDAVSLALFGMTPRLDAEHGNEAADPRAIMSRGTGECSARVMFSKIEKGARQKYRARWTCWRAHKKPDGAWQRAIRSLERLTDTSIYQRIGARAARLQRRHASRLAALRTLAAAGGWLDAGALAALEDAAALLALRLDDEQLTDLRQQRKELADRKLQVETRILERRQQVEAYANTRPEALPEEPARDALMAAVAEAKALHEEADETHQATGDSPRDHHRAVQEQADNQRALREAEQEARVWQTLHQHIGVNDGGKFKQFAQALNLGQLLDKANVHLGRLSRRYQLIPRLHGGLPTLEFDLSDLWQVGERVAPRALSGGVRFLVSLSLALGLSDFRAVKMPIETLLLDEGFGTLDPDTLGVALAALSQLQADGRQVGIISHVCRPIWRRRTSFPIIHPPLRDGGLVRYRRHAVAWWILPSDKGGMPQIVLVSSPIPLRSGPGNNNNIRIVPKRDAPEPVGQRSIANAE